MSLSTWIRGIALLRHPSLVRELEHRFVHLSQVDVIRQGSRDCRVSDAVILRNFDAARLKLQERVTISEGVVLSFGDQQTGFGRIEIGSDTWIGQYNNFRAGGSEIRIGQHCLISQFCTLVASGHGIARGAPIQSQSPPGDRLGVTLGDDVWLGAGVAIMPGVKVGNGAVIGAGSVVTKHVPDNEIWTGIPAKRRGERLE